MYEYRSLCDKGTEAVIPCRYARVTLLLRKRVARVSEGLIPSDHLETIALFIPTPRQGVSRNGDRKRDRHPIGVVYIGYISSDPGSSALRASTAGLCRTDPYRGPLPGQQTGQHLWAAPLGCSFLRHRSSAKR